MDSGNRFDWVPFYEELANKLLDFKDNQKQLVDDVYSIYKMPGIVAPNRVKEGTLKGIDPFTFFSFFNRGLTDDNRKYIIKAIREFWTLSSSVPASFEGIPKSYNDKYMYYNDTSPEYKDEIDTLWNLFEAAINYANGTTDKRNLVSEYFDQAINITGNKNSKITDGLFWIAPKVFLNLDKKNIHYIYKSGEIPDEVVDTLPLKPDKEDELDRLSADTYFDIVDKIKDYLQSVDSNFCELSYKAYEYKPENNKGNEKEKGGNTIAKTEAEALTEKQKDIDKDSKALVTGGSNILYYGVPGAGKSYEVDCEIRGKIGDDNSKVERVVFHPDYTYSDFVGQILPKCVKGEGDKDDRLEYSFVPGPFTRILSEAISDPDNMYFLVIEEINRGNAPAIFGDIFQLLDRDEDGNGKYSITNYDIADYVYEVYGEMKGPEAIADYKDKNGDYKVRIPANLTLYATMNTSDQNVFTLDTAFQRRWDMQLIFNEIDAKHANQTIGNSTITWGAFVKVINDKILDENKNMISSEDKRLGAYFMTKSELEEDNRRSREDNDYRSKFAEKVLKYLWDDAFKMSRDDVFQNFKSLEDIISKYEKTKTEDPLKVVLKEEIYKEMSPETNESDTAESDNKQNQD